MIERLPSGIKKFLITLSGIFTYTFKFFRHLLLPPFEIKETLNQIYKVGVNSLLLVTTTGFIIGMVMTLQVIPTMEKFGAESWIPSMVSISIIREIGPVLTALICAGKVGSGIGAELGSMTVTEQVDAIEASGADEFNYLVVTRVLATTLALPLLVFYADAVALAGSYTGINLVENISFTLYLDEALGAITFMDLGPATIKTVFFGFFVGIISCYHGLNTERGTSGVGLAANSSVVTASLFIFIIDLLVVQLTQVFL